MLELIGVERNVVLSFISFAIAFVIYLQTYSIFRNRCNKTTYIYLSYISIFLFCIFSFWGNDWFYLLDQYPDIEQDGRVTVEDLYVWIAQNIATDYITFRMVVWGIGCSSIFFIFRKINLPVETTLHLFVLFGLLWLSYARQSVCISIMFLGGLLFIDSISNKKWFTFPIATFLIFAAFFFHKSSPYSLACLITAILMTNIKGKIMFIPLLLFPVILYIFRDYLSIYMLRDIDIDNEFMQKSMSTSRWYLEDNIQISSFASKALTYIEYLIYMMISVVSILLHKDDSFNEIPYSIRMFIKLQFIITFTSSVFLFDLGYNTQEMAQRFFRTAFIPSFIILSYLFNQGKYLKITRIIYIMSQICFFANIIYPLYADYITDKF